MQQCIVYLNFCEYENGRLQNAIDRGNRLGFMTIHIESMLMNGEMQIAQ